MRRKLYNRHKKTSAGKLVTGLLLGGVVGATVALLRAPSAGEETQRLQDNVMNARERIKAAEDNVERRVRHLTEPAGENPAASHPHTQVG